MRLKLFEQVAQDRLASFGGDAGNTLRGDLTAEGDDLLVASDPGLAGQDLPTRIETYADHRIAMSFALAGLKIRGLTILDPGCVAKTYPGFWDDLERLRP